MITPITDQTPIYIVAFLMIAFTLFIAGLIHEKGKALETLSLIIFGTILTVAFILI